MENTYKFDGGKITITQNEDMVVSWSKVPTAEYYVLRDENSNIPEIRYEKGDELEYVPFTVGKHPIVIEIYTKTDMYSVAFEAREIPMCFGYHGTMFNTYGCAKGYLPKLGLTEEGLIERSPNYYTVYYNAEKGFVKNSKEATDFSGEPYLSQFLSDCKQIGLNVVMASSYTIYRYPENWETSGLKKLMDTAWYKFGMKTIVWDEPVFDLPRNETLTLDEMRERMNEWYADEKRGLSHYIKHPGYYGMEMTDEPFTTREKGNWRKHNQVVTAGYCYKALKELFEREGIESKFTCALNKYPYVFRGVKGYMEYLEDWVISSGADFIGFDVYLPAISNDSTAPHVVTLQHFETTWKCVRDVADKYNLSIDAATTAFDFSQSGTHAKLTPRDILQNAYFAYMYGSNSILYFAACPFSTGEITNTIFGYDGKPTWVAPWVKTANENITRLRYYLKDYKYLSSNVKDEESYQFVKVLWGDGNNNYAHFYMNMNTSADDSPALAFAQKGEEYIYLKADGSMEKNIADAETAFWLVSGEMFIVFNTTEKFIQYRYED